MVEANFFVVNLAYKPLRIKVYVDHLVEFRFDDILLSNPGRIANHLVDNIAAPLDPYGKPT
jgi:hypothetical protein